MEQSGTVSIHKQQKSRSFINNLLIAKKTGKGACRHKTSFQVKGSHLSRATLIPPGPLSKQEGLIPSTCARVGDFHLSQKHQFYLFYTQL